MQPRSWLRGFGDRFTVAGQDLWILWTAHIELRGMQFWQAYQQTLAGIHLFCWVRISLFSDLKEGG